MKRNKNRGYQKPIVRNDAVGFYARRVMSYMAITPTLHYSNTPILQHSNTPALHYSNTPVLQIPIFDKEQMNAVYQCE
jgi:hypothetical protein